MNNHNSMVEEIACNVCSKPSGISPEECFSSYGKRFTNCQSHGFCRIAEKSDEQLAYVLSSYTDCVFLRACPGSGKTEIIGLKTAHEIATWNQHPGGIAVLSFTNNATEILGARVAQFTGKGSPGYPHFLGTIDSWLQRCLVQPFAHAVTEYGGKGSDRSIRIITCESVASFLNAFSSKYSYAARGNIAANQYYWEAGNDTIHFSSGNRSVDALRSGMSLVDWQISDLLQAKKRFWKYGFATFQDVEYLAYKLIKELPELAVFLARRFPLLIVDECQDLSEAQLGLFGLLMDVGTRLHFVGDLHQAIYAFKKVEPQKVEDFVTVRQFNVYELSQNFRSHQAIVDICSNLLDLTGVSGRTVCKGDPECVYFVYDAGDEPALIDTFVSYAEQIGLNINKSAVLARGHATVCKLRPGSRQESITGALALALAIHVWQSKSLESMKEALICMGKFISTTFFPGVSRNVQCYYCPETVASPLQWRISLSRILDACVNNSQVGDLTQVWTKWVRTLKLHLSGIITQYCFKADCAGIDGLQSPNGYASRVIIETLGTSTRRDVPAIRITTIHQAKGETLEAVLLVSSADNKGNSGGHWRAWLNSSGDGEHARFAYVGSSRPKRLLAWAIPTPSKNDLQTLNKLGFKPATLHPTP